MTKKILIGVLVAVLLLGIGGVSFAALKVAEKGEAQETKAEVQATARTVDEKLAEVWEQLELRDTEWAQLKDDPALNPDLLLQSAPGDVEEIKAKADEARELADGIPDEDVKAAYLAVCDELDGELDKSLEEAAKIQPICDAYLLCWQAMGNNVSGWNALQASIESCNSRNYGQAKTQAQEAQAQYEAMKTAYQQAASLSGMDEVAAAVQYAEAQLQVCAAQQELTRLGSKGGVNSYNAQIERLNELTAQAEAIDRLGEHAAYTLWLKAQAGYGNYEDRAIKAHMMWEDAQELAAGA